jgi:chitin synthase
VACSIHRPAPPPSSFLTFLFFPFLLRLPFALTQSIMDNRNSQRPPRAARPSQHLSQSPAVSDQQRPQFPPSDSSKSGISFRNVEQGDRQAALDSHRQRTMPSAYQPQFNTDMEHMDQLDPAKFGRKKSLVRPDREKIDPGHRQFHYRSHAAQLEEGHGRVGVMPSCKSCHSCFFSLLQLILSATGNYPQLRRGRSLLAREEDVNESGLALFKRNATLRRRRTQTQLSVPPPVSNDKKRRGCWKGPGPGGPWMTYCLLLTIFIPGFLLRSCGRFISLMIHEIQYAQPSFFLIQRHPQS